MGESNPVTASSLLINAYVSDLAVTAASAAPKVGWDFEDESPGNDARGFSPEGALAPEIETHLVNAVLTNGARFYVDHAHPELSTPECADARSVVVWDRAAEQILARAMEAAGRLLPAGQEIVVHKNNSDGKGNSYGCHENYLMDRSVPFNRIITHATAHFVTRQIFTGAGKVGSEATGVSLEDVPYQLSQRSDFFEAEVGLETTLKRPIVNTRDEPHADSQKYRRLHVIVGDANLAEVATFLKVGTTALVLAMVEDDFLPRDFVFRDAGAGHAPGVLRHLARPAASSWSTAPRSPRWRCSGSCSTGPASTRRTAASTVVGEEVGADVLARWEHVLTGLETDPESVAGQVDWVAKRRVIEGWRERHGAAVGRPPGRRPGAAVPRPPAGAQPRGARRPRADHRRRRGGAGPHRAARGHPGVLPGPVPVEVRLVDRGRQLGLTGLRRGERAAAAGSDDGTHAWNPGPRRYVVGRMHHAGRAARQTGLVTGGREGL